MAEQKEPVVKEPVISEEIINEIREKTLIIDKYYDSFNEYHTIPRDYGNGEITNKAEVHTLINIEENRGVTVTELAQMIRRTKGAISQMVSKLENKGYIYKLKDTYDAKRIFLHVTDKGRELVRLHKAFDKEIIDRTTRKALQTFSPEELFIFFKVMNIYSKIIDEYVEEFNPNIDKKDIDKKGKS